MNFEKKFFVTLLLVVVLFTASLGRRIDPKFDFNSVENCNETETNRFISIMENITNSDIPFLDHRIIVLTDSEKNIYEPLRQKLIEKKVMFLPFHRTLNNDIQETLRTVVILSRTKYISFLIHSNNVDNAVNIFKNLTLFLPYGTLYSTNIAFALTIPESDDDEEGVMEQLTKKLADFATSINKSPFSRFLMDLRSNRIKISIFTNKSCDLNVNSLTQSLEKKIQVLVTFRFLYRFNISKQIEQMHKCGIQYVIQQVSFDVENLLKQISATIKQEERYKNTNTFDTLATVYNCIWSFARSKTSQDMYYYSRKLYMCFENLYFGWKYPESLSIQLNKSNELYDVIFFLNYNAQFPYASTPWTERLKNFHLESSEYFDNWYQKSNNDQLLPRKIVQSCNIKDNEYKLLVTGNVVKLSDINIHTCSDEPKVIEIFAIEKVIINKDIVMIGKEIQMIIIAPTWEVSNKKTNIVINLSGNNGTDFEEKQAKNGTSKNGNRNGANGLAGVPGGPAGSFYGIADNIINPEKLIILANGGRGGNGQHGGDGASGRNGLKYNGVPALNCKQLPIGWDGYLLSSSRSGYQPITETETYKIYGRKGKNGGNGGNGGIRGFGGKKGSATIFEISNQNTSSFHLSTVDGEAGSDGIGGKYGYGGSNGKSVMNKIECHYMTGTCMKTYHDPIEMSGWAGSASMGSEGKTGTSLKRQIVTESLQTTNILPSSVNRYKSYIRPYLTDKENRLLWSFYNDLNTQENIIKLYDTFSLVEDFTALEKQFFSLKMNFTSSYEQLKKRIDTYAKNPHKEEATAEYRNIIKDLKTDIDDRLKSVQSLHFDYKVNTDFLEEGENYLLRKINKLIDFRKTRNILYHLNENILLLENNMKNGTKLIGDVVINAISDLEETLDEDLGSLLSEITDMETEAYANQTELAQNRVKLEEIMHLRAMFGVLKIGCSALGVINPALGLIGGVAVSAITVLEAKTTDDTEAFVTVLPKALENITKQSEEYYKKLNEKQEEVIKEQEKFINEEKKKATSSGVGIINQVWDASVEFRHPNGATVTVRKSGYGMKQVYARKEEELTKNLIELEKSGNKANSEEVNAVKKGITVAKYLKVTSDAFQIGSETALKIMKDEKKINAIDEAVKKNKQAIEALHLMEENIYNNIQPLLNGMNTNLNSVEHNLKNMNQFQQAIAKWNVTRTIEDIKHTLNRATKDFKINEKMNLSFRELIKTFDLLFEEHKLLLNSKEKQKDKIDETILHIAHDSHLKINDYHLLYALSALDVVQTSNYVAEKYQKWSAAIKQYAFPYVGEKLEKFHNSEEFKEQGITEFANFIVKNIDSLMENSHSTIFTDHKDKLHLRGSNFHDDRSKFAFYTWKNGQNKQAICNILDGNETTLVADIHNGDFHAEAVKFNRVKLLFTTAIPNNQEELNSVLKNFDVKLTHHGDSMYKYGEFIYEIKNSLTPMRFNYDINDTVRENNFVSRLANGPYLLSPYATWTIQLLPIHDGRKFESLEKFKDIVDLELIGNAEYSNNTVCDSTCENAMQKYYTLKSKY